MVITENSLHDSIAAAAKIVDERLAKYPKHGVYTHAAEQLVAMSVFVDDGRWRTASRDFVDIGLMAAREMDPSDPELAELLMLADYQFKNFPG